MRLRSDLFVAAYVRLRNAENAFAVVRRKGAPEAGAIFILIDRRDGNVDLYGPAPQSLVEDATGNRRFQHLGSDAEARLAREVRFDPDLWIIDVEDPSGNHRLDLVHI